MKAWIDYIGVWVWWLVVNDNWQVLLMKRWPKSKILAWYRSQPWWAVEFGERAENAMFREIKEELDIEVEVVRFVWITETLSEWQHWVNPSYILKIKSGTPKPMEKDKWKVDEVRRFDLDSLPELITPYTIDTINAYKKLKNSL